MAPPWGHCSYVLPPPYLSVVSKSHHRAHHLGIVRVEFGRQNHRSHVFPVSLGAGVNGGRRVGLLLWRSRRPLHLAPSVLGWTATIRPYRLDHNRSTADRRPGLPRQVSASTASWCTEPITSYHVAAQSATTSQPAVKATDVLQKSPPIFVESTRSPI